MKFGILGAMPQEVALMARSMAVRRSVEVGMRTFFEGTWAGQEVVVVLSRVGKIQGVPRMPDLSPRERRSLRCTSWQALPID
jgi:Phosphorylase superfamily